jgi:hypothetical protein
LALHPGLDAGIARLLFGFIPGTGGIVSHALRQMGANRDAQPADRSGLRRRAQA